MGNPMQRPIVRRMQLPIKERTLGFESGEMGETIGYSVDCTWVVVYCLGPSGVNSR